MELPEYETLMQMIHSKLDEVGRNQQDLAQAIDVNAGTLSRYLAGEATASYERLREMYMVLREWEEKQRQPATELMTEGFTSTILNESRREAADKMLEGDFSQLPVREMEDGKVIGLVTDADLMRVHDDEKPIGEIQHQHVIEIARDTDRSLIEKILEEGHPAVLVGGDDTPEGIITRADLLETASSTS